MLKPIHASLTLQVLSPLCGMPCELPAPRTANGKNVISGDKNKNCWYNDVILGHCKMFFFLNPRHNLHWISNKSKVLKSESEALWAEGDKDWVKPTWSVGMAGEVEGALKLPVTNTQLGGCMPHSGGKLEWRAISFLGPASPGIQHLKALVKSAPAGFAHPRQTGIMG